MTDPTFKICYTPELATEVSKHLMSLDGQLWIRFWLLSVAAVEWLILGESPDRVSSFAIGLLCSFLVTFAVRSGRIKQAVMGRLSTHWVCTMTDSDFTWEDSRGVRCFVPSKLMRPVSESPLGWAFSVGPEKLFVPRQCLQDGGVEAQFKDRLASS